MGLVHGLSSVYLDKLKTVDVIIRNTQGAESLVKGYEVKLSQEEAVPTDLAAIRAHQTTLQQWTSEVKDKKAVFTALEEDLSRAKVVAEQLFRLKQERSVDLERYQEKGAQLWERWQRVGLQVETRQSDLESIQDVLGDYRSCHGALIRWIEETTAQQEAMKPGQAEDSRVLSEQLSQQMALFAEIEANQAKLDQCQKLSQQYSAAVKDYELQLMAYRAFVESQQKSPVKRRRMLSSSDTITQEFMDLRTRYTALVTLTTQHVKYISDALRRLEEEEKVVEEEKLEHVDKVKALLGWVSNFKQSSQFKNMPPESKDLGDIEKSILEQQVLNEELAAKKEQVSEAIKTAQMFVARHNNKLSGQEKEVILAQLDVLRETYDQLCSESSDQLQQLQSHMAQETAHKTLQEQQVIRSRNLEELCSWMNQAEARLQDPQGAMHKGELSLLEQKQSDIKDLQRNMHSRSASFAGILKATEEFMEDNQAKLDPQELASLRARHGQAKEQLQSLQERVEATHKELESAVSTVVQQQTQKVKAVKDFEENHNKIESLLHWMSSLEKSRESTKSRSLSLSQKAGDQKDGRTPDTPDGRPVEADRAHHQELLSQQQEVLLSAQSAQAFLEKRGHNLSPAETQQLQGKLDELKDQYASKLSQSEAQLKQVQSLQDELQKFLRDHLEFEAWLLQAEQELDRMHHGDGGLEALRPMLHRQSSFSEDVISHKGDLRFVTMSGQKVLDAEKATAGPEVSSTGALVTSKLEDATKRYGTLHSKCAALGSHLNLLLDRSQQFQDIANSLQTWLQRSEAAVSNLLSEPISSDPAILQKQLASAKRLQEDLAEHQVPVEKLEKASRSLLEIHQAPVPDHKSIQETTASVMSRFQGLWGRMAERSDLLQKAIAQSQSVQEGLEGLARSMAHIEESLQRQEGTPFSAAAVQEALANNTKLKQDLDRQRSLLEATQGMVARFAEAAESGAAAAALRSQLDSLTERFGSLCQRRQKEEETLKELLPKVEQHEQLSQALEQFTETRGRMLAAGNQPHHDIGHFSQQIQVSKSDIFTPPRLHLHCRVNAG
uniref:Microtubule actin crosslinking factor 1 n=1 Tax=Anolis carolinensis TaxID=28377 RepID=H9G7F6_ANOCA